MSAGGSGFRLTVSDESEFRLTETDQSEFSLTGSDPCERSEFCLDQLYVYVYLICFYPNPYYCYKYFIKCTFYMNKKCTVLSSKISIDNA